MKNDWRAGDGHCRSCHVRAGLKDRLKEIRADIPAHGELQRQIFDAFLNRLDRQKRIKEVDLQFATELCDFLSREPSLQIRSWADAIGLSTKLGIKATTHRTARYQPFFDVARELEKQGKIPANYKTAGRLERTLSWFNPMNRPIVERYLKEGADQDALYSQFRMAARILDYERYLGGKDLFTNDPEIAREYIRQLPTAKGKGTYTEFTLLRRFFRWSLKAGLSRVDPYADWYPEKSFTITCKNCGKFSPATSHSKLCNACDKRRVTALSHEPLDRLTCSFSSPCAYNQHLLDLYIKYLKRHIVTEHHLLASKAFMQWLELRSIPTIRSWGEVLALSGEFNQAQKQPRVHVCPFVVVGRMLQELGVLPLREIDRENSTQALIESCPKEIARILSRYCALLQKTKYRSISQYGTIRTLVEVHRWLGKNRPEHNLLTVNGEILKQYILSLGNQDRGGIRRYILRRFYRWMCLEKLVLLNPMEGTEFPKSIRKLCVCTDDQIRKIESFVKNPKSDPEQALFLTLSLYWGFNAKELAFASIEIHNNSQIWILFHRQPLTRGRHSHYRDQVLKLPVMPEWLGQLQKRYIQVWREKFDKIPKNFPVQPLVLGRERNGHLNSVRVMQLFYKATLAATESKIPPNVVRRTSAHIHTNYGDATRLAKLGWAKRHCHDFSIYPRTYFTPKS